MPVNDDGVFVCKLCGAEGIESWPYVHCYKCGNREDRPDLGLDADAQPLSVSGTVFGGGTPDESSVMNVPTTQDEQPPEMASTSNDVADRSPLTTEGTDL